MVLQKSYLTSIVTAFLAVFWHGFWGLKGGTGQPAGCTCNLCIVYIAEWQQPPRAGIVGFLGSLPRPFVVADNPPYSHYPPPKFACHAQSTTIAEAPPTGAKTPAHALPISWHKTTC